MKGRKLGVLTRRTLQGNPSGLKPRSGASSTSTSGTTIYWERGRMCYRFNSNLLNSASVGLRQVLAAGGKKLKSEAAENIGSSIQTTTNLALKLTIVRLKIDGKLQRKNVRHAFLTSTKGNGSLKKIEQTINPLLWLTPRGLQAMQKIQRTNWR